MPPSQIGTSNAFFTRSEHVTNWLQRVSQHIVLSLGFILTAHVFLLAPTAAEQPPFVASFDRFGRHGDIERVTAGRLLLSELSCTACHATSQQSVIPKRGPRLDGAGRELDKAWVTRFITAPQAVKPGTTMPDVLAGLPENERAETARALTEFLMSQQRNLPEIKAGGASPVPQQFWTLGDPLNGQKLFHRIGCVACHHPDASYETVATKPTPLDQLLDQLDPDEIKELGLASAMRRVDSVPLPDLADKYSFQSLTHFLIDPHRNRPSGRMPQLKLNVVQAADIATWLMQSTAGRSQRALDAFTPPAIDRSLAARGQKLFTALGCVQCHTAGGLKPTKAAKPLEQLTLAERSCIANPDRGMPHFPLDTAQQAALQAALKEISKPEPTQDATERVHFTLLQLNCLACHERDKLGGIGRFRKAYFETYGNIDIGDEGRLPPPLTGVGHKLQQKWLETVFQGKAQLRPHMRIQMPVFPADVVRQLPSAFAQADAREPAQSAAKLFPPEPGQLDAGRALLDTGCIQCHSLRGHALPGVVGVDLANVTKRIRPQWFHDFLLNPSTWKPRTRMPTFFPQGVGQLKTVYDGDADRQIAAMWHYLNAASSPPLPPKIEKARSQNYELVPEDRPLLLRTFMKEAGTHAIAVGLPEKIHFAFDAERVRLSLAWRGRFLDARGTWFERFTPPAKPLGDGMLQFPPGLLIAPLKAAADPWPTSVPVQFRGYRLDQRGIPTFLYRLANHDIEERITAGDQSQLIRHLTLRHDTDDVRLWIRPLVGKSLSRKGPFQYATASGTTVSVHGLSEPGKLRQQSDTNSDWIMPLPTAATTKIELRYQW